MDANSSDEEELERLEEMRKSLLAQLEEDGEEEENGEISKLDESIIEEEEGLSDDDDEEKMNGHNDNEEEEELQSSSNEEEEEMEEEENDLLNESGLLEEEEEEMVEVVDSEQIDNLLENPVDEKCKDSGKKPRQMLKRIKRVLEFRNTDHFNVLPDGWIELTHSSGLPIFVHKPTRVCTFARPYFIGRGSIQYHRVPESAIPCLYQKKFQEEMEKIVHGKEQLTNGQKDENGESMENNVDENCDNQPHDASILSQLNGPSVKVETEVEFNKKQLSPDQLFEYAKRRFKFKEIPVFKFKKWDEKRKFHKRRRMRQVLLKQHKEANKSINGGQIQRPGISNGMKLITIPALDADAKPNKRPFYLNPNGKTSVSILHEFVQKALKCTVRYFFSEARNSATPFHCAVKLVLNNSHPNSLMGHGGGRNGGGGHKNGQQQFQQSAAPINADSMRQKLAKLDEFNKNRKQQIQDELQPHCPFGNGGENAASLCANSSDDPDFITLGEAFGPGKKNAKLSAAKNALDNLVPGIDFDSDMIALSNNNNSPKKEASSNNIGNFSLAESEQFDTSSLANGSVNGLNASLNESAQIFDLISVTDTRIPELCARAGQPSPYLILQEYLKRYSAFGDTQLNFTSTRLKHERHQFQLSIGEHSVKVVSRNKRDGKQMAAQALLKKLHPKNETWGSILRLYGYEAQQKFREARKSKDSVVKLQGIRPDESKSIGEFQPNALILDKLHAHMLKLSEKLLPNDAPPAKIRKVDFQAEQPILSEEELRKLSAKMAADHPELQQCLPSVRF